MFIKIPRYSQKNTCARISFLIKLQAEAFNSINKETLVQVFSSEFCEIFKNFFFYRTPPMVASESKSHPDKISIWHIQAYSGIFGTVCYSNIFQTVVYPEPWHIQNQKHIHNPGVFTTLVYSERWHYQNLRHVHNPVTHLQWSSQIIIIFAKLALLK